MRRAAQQFVIDDMGRENAKILARPEYLDGHAELIFRSITDRLCLEQGGEPFHFADFMFQYREAANFPWVSQAQWLYSQMIRWDGGAIDLDDAARAGAVFRPDVYRSALLGTDEPLPAASSKVEGSLARLTAVGAQQGAIVLADNRFFDGRVFDPYEIEAYAAGWQSPDR